MGNTGSSVKKRHRQGQENRLRNRAVRSKTRAAIRKFADQATSNGDKEQTTRLFCQAQKLLDTAAQKGVYHRNTVARKKSRLSKMMAR